MIIVSDNEFEVGKVYNMEISDDYGYFHFIPFKILGISTREEYIKSYEDAKRDNPKIANIWDEEGDKYYLVSID